MRCVCRRVREKSVWRSSWSVIIPLCATLVLSGAVVIPLFDLGTRSIWPGLSLPRDSGPEVFAFRLSELDTLQTV